jgi:stage II sporulation protein D
MDVESQFWVRVLLLSNATECTVAAPSPLRVSEHDLSPALPTAEPLTDPIDSPVRVTLSNGRIVLGTTPQASGEVILSAERPHVFTLNKQSYRGRLKLILNRDGQSFRAINFVPLEPYLAGVIGAEMPDYWEPQALRAQTIAARTYCLYTKNRFGANRDWDVSSTQSSQVYRGLSAESAQIWNAVTGTYGQVLVSKQERTGEPALFPAYFSAICGGHTESCEPVFGEAFGPLQAVPCPYCKEVAKMGLFFWPMVQLDKATVTSRLVARYPNLEKLGEITGMVAIAKSDYGPFSRLTRIRLTGSTGKTDILRAEDLRLTLDPTGRKIQSAICHIVPWGNGWAFLSGRGWGHGVGMCQNGAEGMARLGRTAEQILQHYYPGSTIVSLY